MPKRKKQPKKNNNTKKQKKTKISSFILGSFMRYTLLPFLDLFDLVAFSQLTHDTRDYCLDPTLWNARNCLRIDTSSKYINMPAHVRGCVASITMSAQVLRQWTRMISSFSQVRHITITKADIYLTTRKLTHFVHQLSSTACSLSLDRPSGHWYNSFSESIRGISSPIRFWSGNGEPFPYLTAVASTHVEYGIGSNTFPNVQFVHCMDWNDRAYPFGSTHVNDYVDHIPSSVQALIVDYNIVFLNEGYRRSLRHLRFDSPSTHSALDGIFTALPWGRRLDHLCTSCYANLETIEVYVSVHNGFTLSGPSIYYDRSICSIERAMFPKLKRLHIVHAPLHLRFHLSHRYTEEELAVPNIPGLDIIVEEGKEPRGEELLLSHLDQAFGKGPLGTAKQAFERYSAQTTTTTIEK